MLQDTQTIRYYQKLTDALVDMWNRGHRYEEMRSYMDGFIACLRMTNIVEPYIIHRLEEDAYRFLRDPSNFEMALPQPEPDYY
ncbi:conserved hypothetical protein [Gloeothece citriformis PCC 7424]|uniref:Uncharacterized protein n=1 Tax=Gloeothece citriformis (strain PCC 7424) TaxID=65393 RepID=B7K8Z2_GLOC7|nr:DUF6761 family protein [Gloeothece citriformis]ACK72761.1 conserved hypothetical protein [Gloeothece citriformis PCC 7424]